MVNLFQLAVVKIRRVRECDLFVGIYAHRYGTIDDNSGKSITELEFEEAKIAFNGGTLKEILLYIIKSDATWLSEFKDSDPLAFEGLERLKEKSKKHTYTTFSKKEDLIFFVIQDISRRLWQFKDQTTLAIRMQILQPTQFLSRPVGMEFFSIKYRNYLFGRSNDVSALINLMEDNPIILILGESGVGKTSLIHAGLIPSLIEKDWSFNEDCLFL
jgi:type IV secretory pathway ATPase VirB11/archaellum biosynthesis ATPase